MKSYLNKKNYKTWKDTTLPDTNNASLLGLGIIELNATELCNRTCSFCPRHDPKIYPNRNLNMSLNTIKVLRHQLDSLDFNGYIGFCGMGEPTLNPLLMELAKEISHYTLEITTNGDTILKNKITIDNLKDVGFDRIVITDYDRNSKWEDYILKYPDLVVRDHYDDGTDKFKELNFSNRAGSLWDINEPIMKPCYIPFYKIMIDWNGDVILCSHNWINKKIFGNIHRTPIDQIWMSNDFMEYRKKLFNGDRSESPCNKCDVKGNFLGEKYMKEWKKALVS